MRSGTPLHSDRRHPFALAPEQLWQVLQRVDTYPIWWPWLRALDATRLEQGAVWSAVVQPPLPYRLRFDVQIQEVVAARRVRAEITGDIAGPAQLEITATATGSELHLVSELAPQHAALRALSRVAQPVMRLGHDWVLDTGLRQFRERALG